MNINIYTYIHIYIYKKKMSGIQPTKIDYQGIQFIKPDETSNTTLSADNGLEIKYDITTPNPKTFKITQTGINFKDNTNNNTTSLDRLALVQQAFQAVELPPNATTLKINKTLELNNGTDNGQITINSSGNTEIVCSKNFELNELAIFNIVPTCPTLPTAGIQLTNKSYVDRLNIQLGNKSAVQIDGPLSGDVIATSCPITLTPGTWICQAQITVVNLATTDSALCYIYNGSTNSSVSNSLGTCGVSFTTQYTNLISNMTVITVSSNTVIYPAGTRNGTSQLRLPLVNICNGSGGSNAIITAFRIF